MKTEKPLNNKEYRRFGSLLRRKLIELGIEDKILMKATGKFRNVVVFEDNKLQVRKAPILRAVNLNRSMMKRFLSMTRADIAKLLSTTPEEMKAFAGAKNASAPVPTAPAADQTLAPKEG